jgi:cyclopropane fatty-acyl-phospholipid synthase-like methyltransferase
MTPGQLVRSLLGPKLFKPIGRVYRRVFVDLERVAASFPALPHGGHILEVGGGDGQMMNVVLARYPDAHATMIDISGQLGDDLDPALRSRVEVLPRTSIRDYLALGRPAPDMVTVCDVVHHVPPAARAQFFEDLGALLKPTSVLVVKDIRPGSLRAWGALVTDQYISGDRGVSQLSEEQLEALVQRTLPSLRAQRTNLVSWDAPNYSIVFSQG